MCFPIPVRVVVVNLLVAMRLATLFMVMVMIVVAMSMPVSVLYPVEMFEHVQVGLIGVLVLLLIDAHPRPFVACCLKRYRSGGRSTTGVSPRPGQNRKRQCTVDDAEVRGDRLT